MVDRVPVTGEILRGSVASLPGLRPGSASPPVAKPTERDRSRPSDGCSCACSLTGSRPWHSGISIGRSSVPHEPREEAFESEAVVAVSRDGRQRIGGGVTLGAADAMARHAVVSLSLSEYLIPAPSGLAQRHRYLFAIACIRKAMEEWLEIASPQRAAIVAFSARLAEPPPSGRAGPNCKRGCSALKTTPDGWPPHRAPAPPPLRVCQRGNAQYARHHDDHAGRYLDVNDLAAGAPLNILASNTTPIECVPAIVDLDLLPDMGRMTGRLLLAENHGCSPAPTAAGSGRR